jgi:hypothetical protein
VIRSVEVGIFGLSGVWLGDFAAQNHHNEPSRVMLFVTLFTFFGSFFLLVARVWADDKQV